MKFFFRITDINLVSERFDYFEPSSVKSVQETTVQHTPTRCHRTPKQHNNNNTEKKELPIKKGQKLEKLQNDNKICDIVKSNNDKKPCDVKSNDKKSCDVKSNDKKSCDAKNDDKNSVQKKPDNSVNKCKVNGDPKFSEIELTEIKKETDVIHNEQCENKVNKVNIKVEADTDEKEIKNDSFKENDSDIANSKSMCELNTISSNAPGSNAKSSDTKVPTPSKDTNVRVPKPETSVSNTNSGLNVLNNKNTENTNITSVKIEPEHPEIDDEKSEFLKSIQLTARNTSPTVPKPSNPEPIRPKIPVAVKRKYVRKGDKSPNLAKKAKLTDNTLARNKILENLTKDKKSDASNKGRKIAPKEPAELKSNKIKDTSAKSVSTATDVDSKLKIRNIKDPVVRLMVSNLNRQASNLTKIVEQTDSSKMIPNNPQNQNDRLQSLIDSCKINIPSSLSITLTESTRNEDGTILETKPTSIKPVQNYIEILKLPDSSPNSSMKPLSEKPNENGTEAAKKDGLKSDNSAGTKGENCTKNSEQNINSSTTASTKNSQKRTFQTMFEETVKRNESLKAQLYHIQNQAKNAELAKKAANCMKPLSLKTGKKLQSNALDLSSKTSPKSDTCTNSDSSTMPSPPPAHSPNVTTPNSRKSLSPAPAHSLNTPNSSTNRSMLSPNASSSHTTSTPNSTSHTNSNKRNILEIAHQLSKRSRLELEVPTLKIPSSPSPNSAPKTSPILKSPKTKDSDSSTPKQIIINSNFSSGGSISIKDSPPKTITSTPKMPIPRLPIAKAPTPKLNPPNIRNGGLLKYSNYAAKLAANSNSAKSPTNQPAKSPNSTKSDSGQSNTVQGLSPNQILEKYNITNLAQYNANLNQAQFAFQQALMMSHQIEIQRMQQQNQNQKHWMNNPNILAHYENYVQSLKKQQNQVCSNGNKN